MKIKCVSCLLLILFGLNTIIGQSEDLKKTVYLKDGSILKGIIVEDNDYFLKLLIETGDTLKIGYKNIISEQVQIQNKRIFKNELSFNTDRAFFKAGLRLATSEHTKYDIEGIIGLRLNQKWQGGLKLTFMSKDDVIGVQYIQPNFLSIGLYGRYNIIKGRPKMFLEGDVGYAMDVGSDRNFEGFGSFEYGGGFQASTSLGVHFATRSKLSWGLKVGVSYTRTTGDITTPDFSNQLRTTIRTVYFKNFIDPYFGFFLEF